MKIVMITDREIPNVGFLQAGKTVSVPADLGEQLIAQGHAAPHRTPPATAQATRKASGRRQGK